MFYRFPAAQFYTKASRTGSLKNGEAKIKITIGQCQFYSLPIQSTVM